MFATHFSIYSRARSIETACLSLVKLFVFQLLSGFGLMQNAMAAHSAEASPTRFAMQITSL